MSIRPRFRAQNCGRAPSGPPTVQGERPPLQLRLCAAPCRRAAARPYGSPRPRPALTGLVERRDHLARLLDIMATKALLWLVRSGCITVLPSKPGAALRILRKTIGIADVVIDTVEDIDPGGWRGRDASSHPSIGVRPAQGVRGVPARSFVPIRSRRDGSRSHAPPLQSRGY